MSSGSSQSSSSVSMTKLGLQLGILNALAPKTKSPVSENKRRNNKKFTEYPPVGESASSKHEARMADVDVNLTFINTRLSVFDGIVASSIHRYPANSSVASPRRPQSPPHFGSAAAAALAARGVDAKLLRVSSPQRSRYQEALYSDSHNASASGPESFGGGSGRGRGSRRTFRMRVDYWADDELRRLSTYSDCNPVPYGRQPAFVELLVPEQASPQELLAAVLDAWSWDHSHSFRFAGPTKPCSASNATSSSSSGATSGGKCKVYEGVAFARDALAPAVNDFGLYRGCTCTLQYDLLGDAWLWLCTCVDVYEFDADCMETPVSQSRFQAAADKPTRPQATVRLVGLGGDVPSQYLWQFERRFRYLDRASHRADDDVISPNAHAKSRESHEARAALRTESEPEEKSLSENAQNTSSASASLASPSPLEKSYRCREREQALHVMGIFRARYTSRKSLEANDELALQYQARLEAAERLRVGGVFYASC
jgi:hypothetical protein